MMYRYLLGYTPPKGPVDTEEPPPKEPGNKWIYAQSEAEAREKFQTYYGTPAGELVVRERF